MTDVIPPVNIKEGDVVRLKVINDCLVTPAPFRTCLSLALLLEQRSPSCSYIRFTLVNTLIPYLSFKQQDNSRMRLL